MSPTAFGPNFIPRALLIRPSRWATRASASPPGPTTATGTGICCTTDDMDEEESSSSKRIQEALNGNEGYDEADGKLKAFNQRCDSYSVIRRPQTFVHAVESFLKTGSVAANWWHGYRTSPEFLKSFEELEVKLQATPRPSKEDASVLEREAAQAMRALFMAKATAEFVTSRQDLQPSTLMMIKMTSTPKQFQQDLEASIRTACPSLSAFEYAEHVLKGMETEKELHRLLRDNGNIGTAEVAQRACGCRSSGAGYWAEHRGTRQAMLVVAHQQEGWTLEGVSEKGRSKHSGLDTTACQLAKLRWGVERVQP